MSDIAVDPDVEDHGRVEGMELFVVTDPGVETSGVGTGTRSDVRCTGIG